MNLYIKDEDMKEAISISYLIWNRMYEEAKTGRFPNKENIVYNMDEIEDGDFKEHIRLFHCALCCIPMYHVDTDLYADIMIVLRACGQCPAIDLWNKHNKIENNNSYTARDTIKGNPYWIYDQQHRNMLSGKEWDVDITLNVCKEIRDFFYKKLSELS